ncbi:hypothetical protein Tco_0151428 [Tanacetum coccineum]
MPIQTRRQLATDLNCSIYALTVSIVEPKNIKEAMADSAWIEAMQDELHQFDRLKVGETRVGIDLKKSFASQVAPWNILDLVCLRSTQDAAHAGCIDTRKSTLEGFSSLGDNACKLDVKETKLHSMSFSRGQSNVALSASCAQPAISATPYTSANTATSIHDIIHKDTG